MQVRLVNRSGLYWLLGASVVLGSIGLFKLYARRKRAQKRRSYARNVVILHQFPPGQKIPSLSPFCLKLETWLRMADIKYQNEFIIFDRSPKGKVPWITLNDVDVSDSQFCIEYLTSNYGKDLSDGLTVVEKSIGRAFSKMIEESFKWVLGAFRYQYGNAKDSGIPYLIFLFFRRRFKKDLITQGYGLHTRDEILEIGKLDLKAVEKFMGNKKYLFGNNPSVEDAVIFAFTAQVYFQDSGPLNDYLTKQCPNLVRHVQTIKEVYWPDWNERISQK